MTDQNRTTFGPENVMAKLTGHLARLIRRHRLDYAAFEAVGPPQSGFLARPLALRDSRFAACPAPG